MAREAASTMRSWRYGQRDGPGGRHHRSDRTRGRRVANWHRRPKRGVQGVFQHVGGVTGAVSGYAGGQKSTADYETVGGGESGHAESVRVTFDPRQISYGRLLQLFFSVAHDPTQLNRQGPDVGTQYRSAIFPTSAEQAQVAEAHIGQLNESRVFKARSSRQSR